MIKSIYMLIIKWKNMITGQSGFHVEQNVGLYYSKTTLKGYYNDLRGKVSDKTFLDDHGIPINMKASGKWIYFPIAIFQYGLGAYDLYLETNDQMYIGYFNNVLNWTYNNQANDGSWNTFGFINDPKLSPVSAMAQGEGGSILLRGYATTHDDKYLLAAKKAIDFMLLPVNKGGTSVKKNGTIILEEYIGRGKSTVLNGWIFALFGLYDYCLATKEKRYLQKLKIIATSIADSLHLFDRGYWSNYNTNGAITSPFYHNLHIAQLKVMYDLFGHEKYLIYHNKWLAYKENRVKSGIAFFIKAFQKIMQSNYKSALVK